MSLFQRAADLPYVAKNSILESTPPTVEEENDPVSDNEEIASVEQALNVTPGKMWRRSLLRKSCLQREGSTCKEGNLEATAVVPSGFPRTSIKIVPLSTANASRPSLLENYAVSLTAPDATPVSAKDVVLQRCGQTAPISFEKCYPNSMLKNCRKIGEGVYGEVFSFRNSSGTTSVMKIIPIEGNININEQRQKKFEEVLSEIVITIELSNLRLNKENQTEGFAQLHKVHCVQGKYPKRLLQFWDLYDKENSSQNDSPEVFKDNQLYIILELGDSGRNLDEYILKNAKQSLLLFKQLVFTLAVAEKKLKFEHRDLHWGNLLISSVEKNKKVKFFLGGIDVEVDTDGVQLTVIDYTVSRITHDGVHIFNDLAEIPNLFDLTGDYQFKIYRLMKERTYNQWKNFEPFTNVLWLDYILDKMVTEMCYRNKSSKVHKTCLEKMEQLRKTVLNYNSCFELATDMIHLKFDNF